MSRHGRRDASPLVSRRSPPHINDKMNSLPSLKGSLPVRIVRSMIPAVLMLGGAVAILMPAGAQVPAPQPMPTLIPAPGPTAPAQNAMPPAAPIAPPGGAPRSFADLTARLTPGHTRGGVTWLTTSAGKRIMFATSLTVAGQKLVGDPVYPEAARDFMTSFARLRAIKADVFLNFHPDFFDMASKRAKQRAGNADAFVDPAELGRQIDRAEAEFRAELAAQQAAAR